MRRITSIVPLQRWTARGSLALALGLALVVTASAQDEPPLAFDGGPYAGTTGVPVAFNGMGSFDADGDPLSYQWDFGDGQLGTGATPTHAYAVAGTYTVTLTVTANGLSGTDQTVAEISDYLGARAFVIGSEITKLSTPKPITVRVESGGGFMLWDVVPTSVIMRAITTRLDRQIRAIPGSVVIDGDRDRNGVPELRAGFSKSDLRGLFLEIAGASVPVKIQGQLRSGAWFSADLVLPLNGTGAAASARLVNDPATGSAVLELAGEPSGELRLRVFDVHGRVVGSRMTRGAASPLRFDLAQVVREAGGPSSGVFFYRVEGEHGTQAGRFVVMR